MALILTPESAAGPSLVPLGEARQLEAEAFRDYAGLIAEVPVEGTGGKFYQACWKPIEGQLPDHRRVYISTDGLLNKVSFAVLPAGDGRPLLEKYEIHNLLSTKDLLRRSRQSGAKSAVLLGNPKFDLERPQGELP